MSSVFKRVGVDRNTIVMNAPIAELFITSHNKFGELRKKGQAKLSSFATQCANIIIEDATVQNNLF